MGGTQTWSPQVSRKTFGPEEETWEPRIYPPLWTRRQEVNELLLNDL